MKITLHVGAAPAFYAVEGVRHQLRAARLASEAVRTADRPDLAASYRVISREALRLSRVNFRRAHCCAQRARYAGTVY